MTTKYEIDGKVFETLVEAEIYCTKEEISSANITPFEESSEETDAETPENLAEVVKEKPEQLIEESPEEPIDEGISEQERKGRIVLEHFDEIKDETLKAMVLSTALGQSSISDDPTAHDKHFKEVRTSENINRLQYESTAERLLDEKSVACPICHLAWGRLAVEEHMKENLNKLLKGSEAWARGMMKSPKQLTKSAMPIVKLIHVRTKHPEVFKFLQKMGLFKVPKKNGNAYTDNRESCTQDLEKLTASEIAEKLSENKDARKKFFRQWMLKLQEKKRK